MVCTRWEVLSLGYFSRNRYWGEQDDVSYRPALCTSVFVEIGGERLIIDPPVTGQDMADMLDRRTGLTVGDIDCVYVTHCHSDHYIGLEAFPNARLFTAPEDLEGVRRVVLNAENNSLLRGVFQNRESLAARLEAAGEEIIPGVKLFRLPGHTLGLAGAVFQAAAGTVAVTGDAVMTADFFRDRRGYYNSADMALSAASIDKIAGTADIVVPGHGNYFWARAHMAD
jgi:glyoxylase-like metal-dependent hydrolase (beta-lactamase superfamily II)